MMLLLRPSLPFVPSWDTALRLPWEAELVDWVVRGHMEENEGASAAAPTTSHTIEDRSEQVHLMPSLAASDPQYFSVLTDRDIQRGDPGQRHQKVPFYWNT